MARCHECDSEVAETDVFCPYCGISLEPVSVGTEETDDSLGAQETDDSLASTIMIQHADLSALKTSPGASEKSEIQQPEPEGKIAVETFESSQPVPEETSTSVNAAESFSVNEVQDEPKPLPIEDESPSPKIEDIPPPSILGDLAKTSDNIKPSSTGEYSLSADQPNHAVAITEQSELVDLHEKVDVEVTPQPGTDAQDLTGGDIAAGYQSEAVAPEPEKPEIEVSSASPEIEERFALSDQPNETLATGSENEVPYSEEAKPAAADVEDESNELNRERALSDEMGIAKPAEELDIGADYPTPSTFDSVRIIEHKVPGADDVDTRIQSIHDHSTTPARAEMAAEPARTSPPEKADSHTAQSIGIGETDGRRSAKLKPLTEGTVLNGRYEIVRKIGGGGMGAVYLASDNNLGGVLRAVKEMVQAHIEEEQQEKAINDFKRESMILSTLDHPSIPTIYDYFYDEKESRFYLVMKYISGGDLSTRIRSAPEGKIDEKSVVEWAIQIIDVLDYLHNQPSTIVYRDLKPSNIMIDGNSGRVMLIDFGIARSINKKEEKGVTAVGTMGYAPPELFSGNVEPRSDIYSLGSTMFHLLTGADPQSNPLLIFDFQKNPRPRHINPQLSDQIERLLMKAVEYNADSRFSSAAEMRTVLTDHLENLKRGNVTYGITEAPASVSLANQNVFCGFCGQRIVATDLFCAFCGAKQPIAQHGVHSEIYTKGALTAKLIIEGTSELAAPAFSLQKDENLVGRRDPMSNIFPEIDLSKYDPQTKISRRHARIWREGNNFMVEDLGSSNGTILAKTMSDFVRLTPNQPQVLSSGDKIKVGDATLHFLIG